MVSIFRGSSQNFFENVFTLLLYGTVGVLNRLCKAVNVNGGIIEHVC
jgi:hypothetical protein